MLAMIVTTNMRIAIEVAMILMIKMVVRMTMLIVIKVAMTLRIAMVQWQERIRLEAFTGCGKPHKIVPFLPFYSIL